MSSSAWYAAFQARLRAQEAGVGDESRRPRNAMRRQSAAAVRGEQRFGRAHADKEDWPLL